MTRRDIYVLCLEHATAMGHAEFRLWFELVPAFDAGQISIEDVRSLIGTSRWRGGRPSRATAYRQIEQWRAKLQEIANPGRGG